MQGKETIAAAAAGGWALGAFSVYNLEMIQAVVGAAEEHDLPLLLQVGSSAFRFAGREPLARAAITAARASSAPVGVHLDHSRSLEEITACIDLGYSSVMFDGSQLPYEQNVALTAQAVEAGHRRGVWVEGELGAIAGDEDRVTGEAALAMTDPVQAREFARRTGVDLLAVAVGNIHGFPAPGQEVKLDLERLRRIAEACPVPLVLHGASGHEPEVLRTAAAAGVVKFNVNAELRRALFAAIHEAYEPALPALDIPALFGAARDAVRQAVGAIALNLAAGATRNQEKVV